MYLVLREKGFFFFLVRRGVVVGFLTFQSVSLIVSFIKFCGFITFLCKVLLVLLSFSKSILLFFLKHFVVVVCCCSIVFLTQKKNG